MNRRVMVGKRATQRRRHLRLILPAKSRQQFSVRFVAQLVDPERRQP